MSCKNKGCNGHARRGQYFCYDCYTAWQQGGDDAVAKRIEEMQKGERELAELKAFKERVFDAVLPAYPGQPSHTVRRTEQALFEVIGAGHYVISKLRTQWYNSPDFSGLNVPKHGPNVRFRRAQFMVDWYTAQLDKANKPKPIVLETFRIKVRPEYGTTCCSDCGTPCWASPFKGCPAEAMVSAREKALKHPSAKVKDEAEPLRQKVAELEGRLALKDRQPVVGVGLYMTGLVAFTGLGAVLGFLLK